MEKATIVGSYGVGLLVNFKLVFTLKASIASVALESAGILEEERTGLGLDIEN